MRGIILAMQVPSVERNDQCAQDEASIRRFDRLVSFEENFGSLVCNIHLVFVLRVFNVNFADTVLRPALKM